MGCEKGFQLGGRAPDKIGVLCRG